MSEQQTAAPPRRRAPPKAKLIEQRVIYRPLADLIPYAKNARTHSKRQIEKLKDGLANLGWGAPMITAGRDMLAGHGRLMAALDMMQEGRAIRFNPDPAQGPTIDLSHLTRTEQRAYILADNRLAVEAGWDLELLADELRGLGDMAGLTGFDKDETASILSGWKTDFARGDKLDAALDPLMGHARVKYRRDDQDAVLAALRAAIKPFDGASIEA